MVRPTHKQLIAGNGPIVSERRPVMVSDGKVFMNNANRQPDGVLLDMLPQYRKVGVIPHTYQPLAFGLHAKRNVSGASFIVWQDSMHSRPVPKGSVGDQR